MDAAEVRKAAKLARLRLSEEEVALYQDQLGRILEHMEELSSLDTSGVPPTSGVRDHANVLREDVIEPFANGEGLLSNAPAREGDYYKVRKVIE